MPTEEPSTSTLENTPVDDANADVIDAAAELESTLDTPPDIDAVRDLVLQAHRDVVPELIVGNSIAELIASVEPSRAAYQRLADSFRSNVEPRSSPPVPAGGDTPAPVDPNRLPAAEKIRRGLSQQSS
jgi:hypothetical protein